MVSLPLGIKNSMSLAMNAAFREDVINMYLNGQMHRNKTEKDEKDSVSLRTGRICNGHKETEILIRVRAVMFKLLDNILLHLFAGFLFVDK